MNPDPAGLERLLRRLEIDEPDRAEVLASLPTPEGGAELWRSLERTIEDLRRSIGQIDTLPSTSPTLGPRDWVYVFLAAVPDIRRWHTAHGVSDEISWDTLADLGRHMRQYRRRQNRLGLDTHWWLALHFRGALYQLGRLQFNPYRLLSGPAGPLFWYDSDRMATLGEGFRSGDRVLGTHIPEAGPLDPEACEASFALAGRFFAEHFPEYASHVATCTSWLLDDQLLEYLPEDSNIVQFQRRFELIPGARDADDSAFHFVFGRSASAASDIQPRTTLERAIVQHVRNGRHWRLRTGWLHLEVRPTSRFSL